MIDLPFAMKAFDDYVAEYDSTLGPIHLKIVHTYAVMDVTKALCLKKHCTQEETDLAMLIGLLHDLGRFEQYKKYQCFEDYKTVDHAAFSSELLFKDGLIRRFIVDPSYDEIIKVAIEQHNKYHVDPGIDAKMLFYVHMIRDSDKLDNFRVKETETMETLFGISYEQLIDETITDTVYEQFASHHLIFGPDRRTHLDMWLSYIAFIFDLNFPESRSYIIDNDWVNRSFDRVQPRDLATLNRYRALKQNILDYLSAYE